MSSSDEPKRRSDAPSAFDAVSAARELEESLDFEASQPQAASPEHYIQMLESEVEGLNIVLTQKEELLRRCEERADEQLGDVERIKQRLKLDADRTADQAISQILVEMLGVADDLERAIQSATNMDHNPDVVEGIRLVYKALLGRFARLGVEPQPSLGEIFDPERHQAISTMPTSDPAQDGLVVAVANEGYSYHGKLLRESRVVVGKLTS